MILWILQGSLNASIENGVTPDDPWIVFVVSILVGPYIGLNIIKWVNMDINFFEEADWYKESKAKQTKKANSYEFTEDGRDVLRNLIKRSTYIILIYYLINKLLTSGVVDFDGSTYLLPVMIIFISFDIFSKKDKIIKQRSGSTQISGQGYIQNTTNPQPVDIFGSDASYANPSNEFHRSKSSSETNSTEPIDSIFSSQVNSNKQTCKKCYGALNKQGKCDQCDVKW